MKQPEYTEGPKAQENFERGMIALFKVSKADLAKAEKKKQQKTSRALKKQKPASDKD